MNDLTREASEREPLFRWIGGILARPDLTPAAKLVAIAIRDRVGLNGESWPALSRLEADTALSRNAVLEGIRQLERCGVLTVSRRGRRGVNVYRFRKCTGSENAPVQKTDGTGSENGPEPVQKLNPNLSNNPEKNLPKKKAGRKAALPEIPEKLRAVEGFEAKWAEWLAYRRQDIRKPVTPRMAAGQFRLLLEQADPVAVLEASIRSGWSGLFPSKDNGRGDKAKTKQTGGKTNENGKYVFWKGGGVRAAGEGLA